MRKILIVVDMQNDFIDGSLGTKEAQEIVAPVAEKIRNFEGDIYGTLDTHEEDYLSTQEGKNLPVMYCICGEDGWALNSEVMQAIAETKAEVHNFCRKNTFGSMELAQMLKETYENQEIEIELIGLCTDICVISNAMLIKAALPEVKISVDPSCCAGVTPESHRNALEAMKMCQILIQKSINKRGLT